MFFKLYEKIVFFSKFSHISETWDKSGPNIGILVSNGMSKKRFSKYKLVCRNKNTLPLQNPVRHFYCFYKGQTIVNDCSIHHSSSPFAFDRIDHRSSAIKLLQNILLGTLWVRCSKTLNTSISALSNNSQAYLKFDFQCDCDRSFN